MKTSAIKAGNLACALGLLLAASPLACLGVTPADGEEPIATAESEAVRLVGDGDHTALARNNEEGPRASHDNTAPCGDRTMAVVHARSGSTFVFCAMSDGEVGVLEELPAGATADRSLVDAYPNAAALLRAVAPEDAALPEGLIASMEAGAVAGRPQSPFPVVLGVAAAAPVTPSLIAACTNAQTFSNTYGYSSYVSFIREFVADPSDCTWHVWYSDSYPLVTSHQRTASASPAYNDFGPPYATACGAKEHVVSCGGSTLFEALRKESAGDAWMTSLSYWVTDGSIATWKMFASDCDIAHDRDDMRFTGNSEPGANHRYSTIFNKWFDGASCDFN